LTFKHSTFLCTFVTAFLEKSKQRQIIKNMADLQFDGDGFLVNPEMWNDEIM